VLQPIKSWTIMAAVLEPAATAFATGDGHEQSAARALAAVSEVDGRQRAVRAAQPGDAALVDRDPRRAQPLGLRAPKALT
jgi:hypothetical protein